MTCYNRKNITVKAIESIVRNVLPEEWMLDIFLMDDKSSDGTSEEVKKLFPNVHIITGTGKLYWNRGMFVSWLYALNYAQFDYFIWFNDDTIIFSDAIQKMINWALEKNNNAIIGGFLTIPNTQEVSYGGLGKNRKALSPNGEFQYVKEINGNFVVIPKKICDKVGILDLNYPHALGDFDYSHRVLKANFETCLSPEFVGVCDKNSQNPDWCNRSVPFLKRLRSLYTPKAYCHPYYQFVFEKKHRGVGIALFHFVTIHFRAVFPSLWKGSGF